ncbi:hypothetical protein [Nonomuraea typhae]|uniref:Polysaccharide chain length determinant N-terminal domain-containing protein n=1 Tax=Nonomuraea typhae TaxID=2603600 RepID=A0ABW7Z627_9ACTN
MDFWSTVGVLFRRWYVVLPAFALAIFISLAVYRTVPAQYASNAVIALTLPLRGGSLPYNPKVPNPEVNPLIVTERGLTSTASILIAALNAPDVATELGAPPGGDVELSVNNGSSNLETSANGPLVYVSVESPSPELSLDLVKKVSARARTELRERELQVGAPAETFIVVTDIVPPTEPEARLARRSRAMVVALALGGMAALTSAYAAESILVARRRKRAEQGPGIAAAPLPERVP